MKFFISELGIKLLFMMILTFSCGSKSKHSNNANTISNTNVLDSNLYYLINNYVQNVDGNFPDKDWLYYYLLFYSENNKSYVTIWVFTAFVNISSSNEYDYGIQIIHDRKVVFVSDNHKKYNSLYLITKEARAKAIDERIKDYKGDIYDGDMYFETYEITKQNDSFEYNKLPKANVSFLDILPPEEYLH